MEATASLQGTSIKYINGLNILNHMKINRALPCLLVSCWLLYTNQTTAFATQKEHNLEPLAAHWTNGVNCECEWRLAREFAPHAIAAFNIYHPTDQIEIPWPAGEQWKMIMVRTNCRTGFYAELLERKKVNGKELLLVFRGTENFRDWTRGNLTIGKFPTGASQYDDALYFGRECRASYPNEGLLLVGHSLGGGLAEYCQRLIENSVAITFNGSPNRGFLYSIFRKRQSREVVRLFERGEILQSTRWVLSPMHRSACDHGSGKRTRWFDFVGTWRKPHSIADHSMGVLAMNLVKLATLAGDPNMKSVLEQMQTSSTAKKTASLP